MRLPGTLSSCTLKTSAYGDSTIPLEKFQGMNVLTEKGKKNKFLFRVEISPGVICLLHVGTCGERTSILFVTSL